MSKKTSNGSPCGNVNIWNVPKALTLKFKTTCLLNGTSMRKQVIAIMRGYVKPGKKVSRP